MSTENTGTGAEPVVTTNIPAPTEGDKSQVQAEEAKTPEAATEGDKEDGTDTTEEADRQKPKRADGGFQRRINRLTADFRAAQQETERALARIRELEGKQTQPVRDDPDLKPPRLDQFTTMEDYEAAKERHIAEKTRRETLKTLEEARKKEADEKAATEQRERITKARERFESDAEKVAEHYEDFDDVMDDFFKGRSPLREFDRQAHEFIFEDAKRAPELVYHLHTNEDVARRIAGMRPVQQVAELARLEASLAKPGAKNVSKAPAPPKRIGGTGGPDGKDPEKMTIDEMRAATGTRRKVDY